jgi:hypothetical protein
VFGKHSPLPRLAPKIWELSENADSRIRAAALGALATIQDQAVGALGRRLLNDKRFGPEFSEAVDLFIRNFDQDDAKLILGALDGLVLDDQQVHAFGMSLRKICENNNTNSVMGLAKWIYETNPCTICRYSAVQIMRGYGELPLEILNECRYDATDEIREQGSSSL